MTAMSTAMSTTTPADKTATDAESIEETVTQLVEIVTEQQQRLDDQAKQIEQLETELAETRQQAAKDRQRITDVEQDVEDTDTNSDNPGVDDGKTTIQHDDLTPVEQLARADNPEAVSSSQSVRRAITVFRNLADWGQRTPKGIVLRPADNPVSLLGAARDESLSWRQWYRAAEALEELSQGAVTFFDSDRHGKMICLHQQSDVYDRVTGSLSVSSVGASV